MQCLDFTRHARLRMVSTTVPDNLAELTSKSLDGLVGLGMLSVATAVFIYYSFWTFALPFIDESHPVTLLFPPREWIIRIPALLLISGLAVVGTFIGIVVIKGERKRQAKQAQKKSQ